MDGDVLAAIAIGVLCVLSLGTPAGSLDTPTLPETGEYSFDMLVPDVDVSGTNGSGASGDNPFGPTTGLGIVPVILVLGLWAIGALYISSVRDFVIAGLVLTGLSLAVIELVGSVSTTTLGSVSIPGAGSTQTLLAAIFGLVLLSAASVVAGPWVRDFARRTHGRLGLFDGGDNADTGTRTRPEPSSEVGRALHALRERVGLDAWTATPREVRAAALDAGFDRQAVETITTRFDDEFYAGESLSADDVEAVSEARKQIESRTPPSSEAGDADAPETADTPGTADTSDESDRHPEVNDP